MTYVDYKIIKINLYSNLKAAVRGLPMKLIGLAFFGVMLTFSLSGTAANTLPAATPSWKKRSSHLTSPVKLQTNARKRRSQTLSTTAPTTKS